jgi:O-antigen ligase
MVWWLLSMSDSATSLSCLLLGAATMAVVGWRIVSKRFLGTYIVATLAVVVALQMSFGGYDGVVKALGRNSTLTDRTAVWQDVIALDDSPILGAGFESFWLGPRLERMWRKWWWHPIQAHNGYIETYLNLGMVGEALLVLLLLATFFKARSELLRDLNYGRYRLGVLFAIIVYNYTEATFKGVHLVWTLFYLIALDYPLESAMASGAAEPAIPPVVLAEADGPLVRGAALSPEGRVV